MKKTLSLIAILPEGKFDPSLLFEKPEQAAAAADTLLREDGTTSVAVEAVLTYNQPHKVFKKRGTKAKAKDPM